MMVVEQHPDLPDPTELIRAVEDLAPRLVDDDAAKVRIQRIDDRDQSLLARLTVDGSRSSVEVIVKAPKRSADRPTAGRLVEPVRDPLRKSRLEFATLSAAAEHFSGLDDPRFGWVRPIAHLPQLSAHVVEVVDQPTLDQLLSAGRSDPSYESGVDALGHVGAWLVQFHGLETREPEPCGGSREVLEDELRQLMDWTHPARSGRLATLVHRTARALPGAFEMGLGHGDLAPRNVFVGPHARVTIIDSLGRFRVPIHIDAGYLLAELSTGTTRFSRGRPTSRRELARQRSMFLDGYGMADDPTLWLFELRALLDKRRSLVQRRGTRGGRRRGSVATDALRLRLVSAEIARIASRLDDR